jgi:hypothetical protein
MSTNSYLRSLTCAVPLVLWAGSALGSMQSHCAAGERWVTGCRDDHCFTTLPINITAEPQNIWKVISDCSNSAVCKEAAKAAAVYFGAPPDAVEAAFAGYERDAAPVLSGRGGGGNEHWINFRAKPGHKLCSMKWKVWSVSGGSTISGSVDAARYLATFYANVPRRGFAQGRSWLKAIVQIHSIRERSYGDNECPQSQVIFDTNGGSPLSGDAIPDFLAGPGGGPAPPDRGPQQC